MRTCNCNYVVHVNVHVNVQCSQGSLKISRICIKDLHVCMLLPDVVRAKKNCLRLHRSAMKYTGLECISDSNIIQNIFNIIFTGAVG